MQKAQTTKTNKAADIFTDWAMGFLRFVVLAALAGLSWYAYDFFAHEIDAGQVVSILERVPQPPDEPQATPEAGARGIYPPPDVERAYLAAREAEGRERFSEILSACPDFWGYIEIPGLLDKHPFVQAADNDYYLFRNLEGVRSASGTVFMDCRNDPYFMDHNTLLYAHNMKSGRMFAALPRKYKEPSAKTIENLEASPVVEVDSLTGRTRWVIFAAFECEKDMGYDITGRDAAQFAGLLDEIRARSVFQCDLPVTPEDRILTLSTCDYSFKNARFVVFARRLRPGEAQPGVRYTLS